MNRKQFIKILALLSVGAITPQAAMAATARAGFFRKKRSSRELLVNGDFETGNLNGWDGIFSDGGSVTVGPPVHGGTYVLDMTPKAVGIHSSYVRQTVSIPGPSTLKFWYWSNRAEAGYVALPNIGADTASTPVVGDSTWHQFSMTSGLVGVQQVGVFAGPVTVDSHFFLDDVSLIS